MGSQSTAACAQRPKSATTVAVWLLGLTVFFAVAPLTAHARWYDPERGVFMSRAPYRPDIEPEYTFNYQDPVNFADPDGEFPIIVVPIILIGVPTAFGVDDIEEGRASSYACKTATENYNRWLTDGNLKKHPRYEYLLQRAYEEWRKDCYGEDGACKNLAEAGEAANNIANGFYGSSAGPRPPKYPPLPVYPTPPQLPIKPR